MISVYTVLQFFPFGLWIVVRSLDRRDIPKSKESWPQLNKFEILDKVLNFMKFRRFLKRKLEFSVSFCLGGSG